MRVGIIGCGAITLHRHAPEYAQNPNAVIAGFYDLNPDRAVALAMRYGGSVYRSVDAMISDPSIDAVSVCTPNDTHAEISIKALHHGKHVLCEKPMASSRDQALQMDEAARFNDRILMIGQNQRLSPAHVQVKAQLDSGRMGKVLRFETCFCHSGPENWSVDRGGSVWFFDKKAARFGVLGDLAIHKLDLIYYLLQERYASVHTITATLDKYDATGSLIPVEDNALCLIIMENGTIGTLCASWTNYGKEDNATRLYCQNGIIRIYDDADNAIQIWYKDGSKECIKTEGLQTNESQTKSGVIDLFINTIIQGNPSPIPASECIHILDVINAAIQSSETGRGVVLDGSVQEDSKK